MPVFLPFFPYHSRGRIAPQVFDGVKLCVARNAERADFAPPLLELQVRVLLIELVLQFNCFPTRERGGEQNGALLKMLAYLDGPFSLLGVVEPHASYSLDLELSQRPHIFGFSACVNTPLTTTSPRKQSCPQRP